MAPSPENDNAPKAPDKGDKTKTGTQSSDTNLELTPSVNKEASVSGLDDIGLKALLDEAISYKTPKDRVGKSELFQNLLEKAEEDDRKARATSASGKESVRYYNTTAKHRTRRRRQPTSVSENLTHGGSLNNLAEEDLYAPTSHLHRLTKTVSTRQRQGGSLPCNVNAGVTSFYDNQFFEEMARKKVEDKKTEYTAIEMESESLLEHDSLNQEYNEPEVEVQTRIPRITTKYTSRFNLDIGGGSANVDDSLTVSALERTTDKILENEISYSKPLETISATNCIPEYLLPSLHSRNIFPLPKYVEDKKVDENGNALGQSDNKKNKKKKIQPADKNVVVLEGKDVIGHRSDIAHDVDKIMEFLGEQESKKANEHRSKANNAKKQRTRSKGKSEKLQKSNSLEEICVSKLDDFNFKECDTGKVPLRSTKSNIERPRERRSWGNSESLPLHASAENLESADFRVVTKKKKAKKIRNSMSSRRQHYTLNLHDNANRNSSPEPRRKSACSVPQSDKSNDSSDVDSVHSLPIDTEHMNIIDSDNLNLPISYAEIAKHSNSLDRPKWNRMPSERKTQIDEVIIPSETSPINVVKVEVPINCHDKVITEKKVIKTPTTNNINKNIKNIQNRIKTEMCASVQPVLLRNIPDVQTIEKQLQQTYSLNYPDIIANHMHNNYLPAFSNKCEQSQVQYKSHNEANPCDSDRTNTRPAVVILSDYGKEVSDLTFGFEVNEQLLSDDVCNYFTSRFYVPDVHVYHQTHDIVDFIGRSWKETLNQSNGTVKYFSDQL